MIDKHLIGVHARFGLDKHIRFLILPPKTANEHQPTEEIALIRLQGLCVHLLLGTYQDYL